MSTRAPAAPGARTGAPKIKNCRTSATMVQVKLAKLQHKPWLLRALVLKDACQQYNQALVYTTNWHIHIVL